MQGIMDQQNLAITELRSYRVEGMFALDSSTPAIGRQPENVTKTMLELLNKTETTYPLHMRGPKIEFPVFDGYDLKDWIYKAQ